MALTRRGLGHLGRVAAFGALAGAVGCSVAGVAPEPLPGTPSPVRIPYGPGRSQWGELHLPAGAGRPKGVVVVLHGGFWRSAYGAGLGTPLAVDLANAGFAAWNLEYRRLGDGGGWPATFSDVAAGVDLLAAHTADRLDLDRVVALGHSAGGQLATWLAGRPKLPAGVPGARPRVRVRGVVSQAGVLDLAVADAAGLGGGAIAALLGGPPARHPERYRWASPAALLPLGVPVVCVHGDADAVVPFEQSAEFVRTAWRAGDPAELVRLDGVDHYALIDPGTQAWRSCRDAVSRLVGRGT